MARLANWQSNLSELIERRRSTPHSMGTFDCTLWAFEAIQAVNGLDLGRNYRGKYKTALGALRALRRVDSVEQPSQLLEKYLGEQKPVAFARKGDIVLLDPHCDGIEVPHDADTFGLVPGVCYGAVSFFAGEFGLVTFETLRTRGVLWVS